MSKHDWALILGASSGFGEATALELAAAGFNIFGVHLDRRETLGHVADIEKRIRESGRESVSSMPTRPMMTNELKSSPA